MLFVTLKRKKAKHIAIDIHIKSIIHQNCRYLIMFSLYMLFSARQITLFQSKPCVTFTTTLPFCLCVFLCEQLYSFQMWECVSLFVVKILR